MELTAKISQDLKQLRIMKQMSTTAYRISLADAKYAWKTGKVKDSNKVFQRLVANEFDVKATLAWYQEQSNR